LPALGLDTIVARKTGAAAAPVDDELVLLDPRRSRYFSFDPTGRRVWEVLEEPQSVRALCTALEREYAVEPERCEAEVVSFHEQLTQHELVETR